MMLMCSSKGDVYHQSIDRGTGLLFSQRYTHYINDAGCYIVDIDIAVVNIGESPYQDKALVLYTPSELVFLDSRPTYEQDWVSYHDSLYGQIEVSFGLLAPNERRTLKLRFLAQACASTVRLYSLNYQDVGNPIFWHQHDSQNGILPLNASFSPAICELFGFGYKPGEPLELWFNLKNQSVQKLDVTPFACSDADGSVYVMVAMAEDVASVVLLGRYSHVVGMIHC